jgi:hypothetical protein|tara:strand:- start:83 stop:409 length:327 start_codon:yes stop_codon:yes gene_type:complete
MHNCVNEESVVMAAATSKVDRNTNMFAVATQMCNTFKHEFEIATEGRNEERDLLSIIKTMAENRMVRYRDASTESKYDSEGNSNVEEYESEEYEEHSYTSSETSGFSI